MAKQQIFERKAPEQDFLAKLEELLKKNRGSGLYEAYDVNPRAFRIGGKVVDPSGLGQDVMKDDLKFAPYDYSSIPMTAPNVGSVGQFDFQQEPIGEMPVQEEKPNYNTAQGFQQVLSEMTAFPVSTTSDGGTLYSNGTVQYQDGTSREATREDVPQIVANFDGGWAMLTNGKVVNLNNQIGRGYRGLSGLMDLLFGRQQTVTQQYGNINPIEPTKGNVNLGTDIRTKDLPQNFNFTLPFEAKVVGITYDDGTRFGSKSGHQGYGNSVLLQLPNGSMIRMAHLSDMENFSVGDIVRPFDYIGTPGQTGNTYGEHLDLEYYNPDGQIANPEQFLLDSMDYVDVKQIEDSQIGGIEKLPPEYQEWAKAQQDLIAQGGQMTLDPSRFQAQEPTPVENIKQAIPQVGQRISNVAQNIAQVPQRIIQATQPMSPERQALGQGIAEVGQKAGLPEMYASEVASGELTPGQAISFNIEQANLTPRIDTGLSELLRGDVSGAKANFQDTLNRAKARIGRLPEEIKSTIIQPVSASEGEAKPRETLAQNVKGALQSAGQYVGEKAGEGLDLLKEKASNLFQKTPLMGLFQGQKQVGDITPGTSLIETAGQRGGTPTPDAFFKYGGADQYAQYLIDNAEQAKGGALDTSLFKPEFFQDPNRVANVFGETSMGGEATGKYKEYLGSQIKPGYDQPYRTEQRQEGDTLYEYKIPVPEYFQNQYYQNLLSQTPETLKTGFSFDQFQLPTTTRSASEYKGQAPVRDSLTPIFKSGIVDLFRRATTNLGQLAGDVLKSPAKVYQSSQPSARFEVPETTRSIFQIPSPSSVVIPPTSIQKTIIKQPEPVKQPTLSDYLARGKTEAQWYAETGQQSTLDAMNKAKAFTSPQSIANFNSQIISSVSPEQARRIGQSVVANRAQEKAQGGIKLPTGAIATVAPANQSNTSQASAQLSGNVNNSKSVFSSGADWLKKLFKK